MWSNQGSNLRYPDLQERVVVVVVLGFYVSPTAKVTRRRDLGLKSHPKDCLQERKLCYFSIILEQLCTIDIEHNSLLSSLVMIDMLLFYSYLFHN